MLGTGYTDSTRRRDRPARSGRVSRWSRADRWLGSTHETRSLASSRSRCSSPLRARARSRSAQKAPDFKLQGSDGKTYSLADFAGKRGFVLAWFPKAFTSGCTAELEDLRDNAAAIAAYDAAVFMVSVDPPEKNAEFAKSVDAKQVLLSDLGGERRGGLRRRRARRLREALDLLRRQGRRRARDRHGGRDRNGGRGHRAQARRAGVPEEVVVTGLRSSRRDHRRAD